VPPGGLAEAGHGWPLGHRAVPRDRTARRCALGVPEITRCDFEKATSARYTRDFAPEITRCGFARSTFGDLKHAAGPAIRLRRALRVKPALEGRHLGDFRRRPARDPSKRQPKRPFWVHSVVAGAGERQKCTWAAPASRQCTQKRTRVPPMHPEAHPRAANAPRSAPACRQCTQKRARVPPMHPEAPRNREKWHRRRRG
jgi:hypothetical protein